MAKKAPESRVILTSSADRTAAPATEAHSTRHHALSSITQNYKQVLGMVAGLALAGVGVAACGDAFEAGNSTTSQTSPNTASNTGGAGGNTPTNTAGGTTGKGGETHTGNGGNGGEGGSGTGGKGGFGGFGGQGGIGGLGGVGGLGGSGGTEIDAGDLDAAVDASMDAKADAALEDAGIDAAGGNGGAGGQGVGGMGGQGGFGGAGGNSIEDAGIDAAGGDSGAGGAGGSPVDAGPLCNAGTATVSVFSPTTFEAVWIRNGLVKASTSFNNSDPIDTSSNQVFFDQNDPVSEGDVIMVQAKDNPEQFPSDPSSKFVTVKVDNCAISCGVIVLNNMTALPLNGQNSFVDYSGKPAAFYIDLPYPNYDNVFDPNVFAGGYVGGPANTKTNLYRCTASAN